MIGNLIDNILLSVTNISYLLIKEPGRDIIKYQVSSTVLRFGFVMTSTIDSSAKFPAVWINFCNGLYFFEHSRHLKTKNII